MSKGSVRIKEEDKEHLNQLKGVESVRQQAVEEGLIDQKTDRMSHEDVFRLIIPEDAEPLSRPEDEMSWQGAGEVKDDILDLAGENVVAHEVVSHFMQQFANEHDIEVNYDRV